MSGLRFQVRYYLSYLHLSSHDACGTSMEEEFSWEQEKEEEVSEIQFEKEEVSGIQFEVSGS